MTILPYHQVESWDFGFPPLTSWRQLMRWIDRWERMVYRVEGESIRMWLPAEVGEGFLAISPLHDQALSLRLFHAGGLNRKAVEQHLRAWWDLDRDMAPFFERFANDGLLRESLKTNQGARIVGFPDLFENLVLGILGQQVNVAFAYTLKQRLTEAFGEVAEFQGETWWRFPRPATLAEASVGQLREMQISQRKAEYVLGVARAMAGNEFSKESLMAMDWAGQMATLTALRGIGSWTAQYVCMKCLHSIRAFPAGDAGLQNAVRDLLAMDRKPTEAELIELSAQWEGWEAYAVWFLWMS